jgi:hypothetical protein
VSDIRTCYQAVLKADVNPVSDEKEGRVKIGVYRTILSVKNRKRLSDVLGFVGSELLLRVHRTS